MALMFIPCIIFKVYSYSKLSHQKKYKRLNWLQNYYILFAGKASIRFKSGAYTLVREHFELNRNAAIGQEMMDLKPVLP